MRKKPDALKRMQKTFRPDRAGVTVEAESEPVLCPSWLDEVGRQTWNRVCAVMDGAGLKFDVELLATFCDSYSHSIKCSEKLRVEGYTIVSDSGLPKINPSVNALRELQKTVMEAGKHLGLSVDSRSKAGLIFKEKEFDEFDEFLRNGRAINGRGGE